MRDAFTLERFDERLAEPLIVLIPKVEAPQRMSQF